jgi:hypothetical protein
LRFKLDHDMQLLRGLLLDLKSMGCNNAKLNKRWDGVETRQHRNGLRFAPKQNQKP